MQARSAPGRSRGSPRTGRGCERGSCQADPPPARPRCATTWNHRRRGPPNPLRAPFLRRSPPDEAFDGAVGKDERLIAGLRRGRALGKHDAGMHERDSPRTQFLGARLDSVSGTGRLNSRAQVGARRPPLHREPHLCRSQWHVRVPDTVGARVRPSRHSLRRVANPRSRTPRLPCTPSGWCGDGVMVSPVSHDWAFESTSVVGSP